jgi:hypothetical protein
MMTFRGFLPRDFLCRARACRARLRGAIVEKHRRFAPDALELRTRLLVHQPRQHKRCCDETLQHDDTQLATVRRRLMPSSQHGDETLNMTPLRAEDSR